MRFTAKYGRKAPLWQSGLTGLLALTAAGCRTGPVDDSGAVAASSSAEAVPSGSAVPVEPQTVPAAELASGLGECKADENHAIFFSPDVPTTKRPLNLMAVTEEAIVQGRLIVVTPNGRAEERETIARGGPPYSWATTFDASGEGAHKIILADAQGVIACRTVSVEDTAARPKRASYQSAWPVKRAWSRSYENYFSAWVEMLFDAPLDDASSWAALHEVSRDPKKNFLHNSQGLDEDADDASGIKMDPDCADLPYFLRAYFAYKNGLPFAYSSCTRGGGGNPPKCLRRFDNLEAVESGSRDPTKVFNNFLRVELKNKVHSGNGRTLGEADETDYYPVPLSAKTIRPGMMYADPYGHLLVVAKKIAQTPEAAGVLFAVDGQPDGTVARRRYWRGNFLFDLSQPELGSPGFKRFRPVVRKGGAIRPLSNAEIQKHPDYGDHSLEQYSLGVDGFYDRMDEVLSPEPLDPEKAMLGLITALHEQTTRRVLSVDNGEKYKSENGGAIEMPDGPSIFETQGPWENFSTPARDLRLLIAIDVVRNFPATVTRTPERFAMPKDATVEAVVASLKKKLNEETEKRKFTYTRSDGSPFELSLADILARSVDLEMAYNPNDCPEIRWAAPTDSPEASTCRRHAPGGQRADMRRYREWFEKRRRPVRR